MCEPTIHVRLHSVQPVALRFTEHEELATRVLQGTLVAGAVVSSRVLVAPTLALDHEGWRALPRVFREDLIGVEFDTEAVRAVEDFLSLHDGFQR